MNKMIVDLQEYILEIEKAYGDRDAYRYLVGDTVVSKTFKQFKKDVHAVASYFTGRGWVGKHIAIIGSSSYHWVTAFLGIECSANVVIPIDRMLPEEEMLGLLKMGDVDGLVSGACHSTANTLRPGLQIIKTAKGVSSVSSFNLMICPPQGNEYCPDGLVVFADCGLNPTYTSEGLADCALATANSAKAIAGIEPKVAMLSFSTKGSAKHDNVSLVAEAVRIAKEKAPDVKIDGELQFDAAIVPSVAALKAPDSPVAGQANVFVFPELQSANIGYKIAERLGGFMAVGPICQGFAKPMNDLSRGCKSEDIVAAVAITALQTQL